jgi:hypothetical protein
MSPLEGTTAEYFPAPVAHWYAQGLTLSTMLGCKWMEGEVRRVAMLTTEEKKGHEHAEAPSHRCSRRVGASLPLLRSSLTGTSSGLHQSNHLPQMQAENAKN